MNQISTCNEDGVSRDEPTENYMETLQSPAALCFGYCAKKFLFWFTLSALISVN